MLIKKGFAYLGKLLVRGYDPQKTDIKNITPTNMHKRFFYSQYKAAEKKVRGI